MNKKAFIVVIALSIIVSLLAGMQNFDVAKANLIPREKPTSPPPIVIQSPLNATYGENEVLLNFTIVGISRWWSVAYHLTDLYYEIDGKSVSLFAVIGSNTEQYVLSLVGLAKGEHILVVHAIGAGVYHTDSGPATYSIESNQTAFFTISKELETTPSPLASTYSIATPTQSTQPTPTAALPTATPTSPPTPSHTPTPISSPTDSPTQRPKIEPISTPNKPIENSSTSIAVMTGLVAALALAGSIICIKRRKGMP